MSSAIDRRRFLQQTALLGAGAAGLSLSAEAPTPPGDGPWPQIPDLDEPDFVPTKPYPDSKPSVIVIRFGGGVRRLETILDAQHTYCPFIYHELYKKNGVCLPNVEIDSSPGIETSHGQGTLYIMTGLRPLCRHRAQAALRSLHPDCADDLRVFPPHLQGRAAPRPHHQRRGPHQRGFLHLQRMQTLWHCLSLDGAEPVSFQAVSAPR